jgi:hypothetical protein
MKIQIVSDIHLGLAPCALPNVGADLLILAGDIHRPVEALRWARGVAPRCGCMATPTTAAITTSSAREYSPTRAVT